MLIELPLLLHDDVDNRSLSRWRIILVVVPVTCNVSVEEVGSGVGEQLVCYIVCLFLALYYYPLVLQYD